MASAKGARNAAIWGSQRLQDNQNNLLSELGQGFDLAKGYLGEAKDLYGGMADQGLAGLSRYQDLAGGNGAGSQTAALQATPGYQFAYDQGMQALERRRAASGMFNTGNTDTDAMKFGAGLASQTLGAERAAQLPLINLYSQGTAGQAGTLGSLAGLGTQYYGARAGVMDDTTKNIVGLGTAAFKAGDAAKQANQQQLMSGIGMGLNLLGSLAGGGMGGMGGGMGGGAGGMLGGFSKLFGG